MWRAKGWENPYHLKDTDGGFYNKYPEFQIWEEGHKAGIKEVVEWIETKKLIIAKSKGEFPIFRNYYDFEVTPDEWQAKLKEWGIEYGQV